MEDNKKGFCPTGKCENLSPQQKVQTIYGGLVVLLTIISGAEGLGFWLLLLLGIGMVVDAVTGKCPMTNFIRKCCGGGACDDKGACDTKPETTENP